MAETQTSRGVVYNEDTSNTPYITESNQKIEGQEPRLLALTSQGKPAYLNNSELLYKKDITLGSNSTITLDTSDTTLLSVPKREGGTASLKVKLPQSKVYSSTLKSGRSSNKPALILKDQDGVTESELIIEGSGSVSVTVSADGNKLFITGDGGTTYDVVSKTSAGLCTQLPSDGNTVKFLRADASWEVPSNATTSTAGFMSAADKTKLDGIETGANKYIHPTSEGNKHIPSGGSSGQILRWKESGTAEWGNDNNTTYSNGNFISIGQDNKINLINYTDSGDAATCKSKIAVRDSSGNLNAVAFFANSDAKLKTNIIDVPKASISKIDKVKIHEFDWKDGGKHSVGVIAQDVKESGLDFLVKGESTLSVDYTSILLLKIASLEEKIKELESKIK